MIERFKVAIKKEIIIYLITLVVLAFVMHIDLLSDPLSRFQAMKDKGNYTHPIFYAFIVYFIILVIRKAIDMIAGIFKK